MGGEKEPRARSAGVKGGAAEICANCPRPGKKRCAACTIPWYCSKECQREHWKKAHRFECKVLQQQRDGSAKLPAGMEAQMRKASMQSRLKQQLGQAQQLHASKKYEEAEKVAAEVALAASTELGNTSILAIESANTLGLILLSQADRTVTNQVDTKMVDAIELWEKQVALRRRAFGTDDPKTQWVLEQLASCKLHTGQYSSAAGLFAELHSSLCRTNGARYPRVLEIALNWANSLLESQQCEDSVNVGNTNYAACRDVFGPDHEITLKVGFNLSCALYGVGSIDEAVALAEKTLECCERTLGSEHPLTQLVEARLSDFEEEVDNTVMLSAKEMDEAWSKASQSSSNENGFAWLMSVTISTLKAVATWFGIFTAEAE